jgi:hypothetical protein
MSTMRKRARPSGPASECCVGSFSAVGCLCRAPISSCTTSRLRFQSEAPEPPTALDLPRTPCSHLPSGLPVSLKDQIEIKGTDFTMSYVGWVGKVAEHDAVIAELLLKQGVSGDVSHAVPFNRTPAKQETAWR